MRTHRVHQVTSPIQSAVAALADQNVSLADALRQLLVVAQRINADDLTAWIKSELNGYSAGNPVPEYRGGRKLKVAVVFVEPMGMGPDETFEFSRSDLPHVLAGAFDAVRIRQPVAELEALADTGGMSGMQLPAAFLKKFRELADAGQVAHLPGYVANEARILVPNTYLLGVLDRVKTNALTLALELEGVAVEAGESGGPTVESDTALDQVVQQNVTNIYANNSNISVASGPNSTATQVIEGNLESLLAAVREYLNEDGVAALRAAIEIDGGRPGTETQSFLDKLKAGKNQLVVGVAGNTAFAAIIELIQTYYPGFSFG